jgi:chromosomal replication initiation ATPase DnaA
MKTIESVMIPLDEYSERINIPYRRLIDKDRRLALPRQAYWYYLREEHACKLKDISVLFGRKHSTIISGITAIRNMIETKNRTVRPYLEALNIFSHQEGWQHGKQTKLAKKT